MKHLSISFMAAALVGLLFSFSSCKDDETTKLSNYDKKMEAVSKQIKSNKKSDKAILLVSFGSTWDAPQESFKKVQEAYKKAFKDRDVFFSFTSNICINRCAQKGWFYYEPSFWLTSLGLAGYKDIAVQSLHVIPGEEYLRVQNVVKDFHNNGDYPKFADVKVYLSGPLLENADTDVNAVAKLLDKQNHDKVASGKIVTFMGHGNPEGWNYGNGNSRYTELETALQKIDPHYFVATVDMEGNKIDDMIERMKKAGFNSGEVFCQPLMSIAGDHANNDMKGGNEAQPEGDSWRAELVKSGYTCPLKNCIIKGLADDPAIVNIWIGHLQKALQEEPMYPKDEE